MEIPVISYDFGYLREEKHVAGQDSRPILVSMNTKHGGLTADMAPTKDHGYLVQRTIQNVSSIQGHTRIIWKGDQEPALTSIRDKVRMTKKVEIMDGDAPVGDSQAHGDGENIVKMMQGAFSSIHGGLQARIRANIPEFMTLSHGC